MDSETQRLIDAGDWRAAAERAESQDDTEAAEALYLRLLDRTAAGRVAEAAGAHVRALSHYLEDGNREGVERLRIAALTSLSPRLPEILELLSTHGWAQQAAELAAALGKLEEAAALFVEARCALEAAVLMERMGRWREAGSLYTEHLHAAPKSLRGHLGLGRVLQRFERHREACDALWAARTQLVGTGGGEASFEETEVRHRLAYSLARLGLAETTRRILRDDPAGVAAVRDLDGFLNELRATYELGEGGVSERYRVHSDASSPAGEAYGAHDSLLSADVLIIPLSGPMSQRAAWIRAQRALSDPPLPDVLALIEADEKARYAVFDTPGGPSLAELLETSPPTGSQLGSLVHQLCQALQQAHSRGVLHGALHPWCLFIRPGFGIAVTGFAQGELGWQEATATVEGADSPIGYLAPEAAVGAPLDLRADFYGVGAIVWRVVTGRQVPLTRNEGWLNVAPDAWRRFFETLLATNAGDRPQSHPELRNLVDRAPWQRLEPPQAAEISGSAPGTRSDAARYREQSRTGVLTVVDDTWLGRSVVRVDQGRPLTTAQQDRVRVFAAPDAPGLQQVLACWPTEGRVHLVHEKASSKAWSALSAAERGHALAQARTALRWLHSRGQTTGGLEAGDLALDSTRGVATIKVGRFLLTSPTADGMAEDDRSLERLARTVSMGGGDVDDSPVQGRESPGHERGVGDDLTLLARYLRGVVGPDPEAETSQQALQALATLEASMAQER